MKLVGHPFEINENRVFNIAYKQGTWRKRWYIAVFKVRICGGTRAQFHTAV